jgi:large subunit ribosomal protein L29
MKIAELRAKSKDELKELVLSLKKEQFNLRMQAATGALEGRSRFKEVRRTIARAKTLLVEEPKTVKAKAARPKVAKVAKEKKEKTAEAPSKAPATKTKKG